MIGYYGIEDPLPDMNFFLIFFFLKKLVFFVCFFVFVFCCFVVVFGAAKCRLLVVKSYW